MKSQKVEIFCGLRVNYGPQHHHIEEAEDICQEYCDHVGLCVTVTPTLYIYKNGREPGFVVGLIRYPRFPETDLWLNAMQLAEILKSRLDQLRVSVMDGDRVEMLGET